MEKLETRIIDNKFMLILITLIGLTKSICQRPTNSIGERLFMSTNKGVNKKHMSRTY